MTQFISTLLLLFVSGCGSIVDWSLLATDEVCDGEDNDLDGAVDEGLAQMMFYVDADGDGFGDPSTPMEACEARATMTTEGNDCDDGDASKYPGAPETCGDGFVNDCNESLAAARAECSVSELGLLRADGILTGEGDGDYAGFTVSSAGDVNGDDVGDLFVGAYKSNLGGDSTGAAFVVFGPLSGTKSLADANVTLLGESVGDYFGYATGGADSTISGGESTLLIGAPHSGLGGARSGAAYVINSPTDDEVKMPSGAEVLFVGESAGDSAGATVAWAGNTNTSIEEYLSSVLVGAPSSDRFAIDAGAAYVFSSIISGEVNLGDADCIISGNHEGDNAGSALAGAGDTNGDGFADILVGARFADTTSSGVDAGLVGLFNGPLSGDLILFDADVELKGESAGDLAGWNVQTAGDTDMDGYADILVAASHNARGGTSAGTVYLVKGPANHQSLADSDAIFTGESAYNDLGTLAKTPQDLNGDGLPDLVFGAQYNSRSGAASGTTYIFLSPMAGVHSVADADVLLTGEAAGDYSGISIAALPDQDGDGLGELLIGAEGSDRAGTDAGAAYLILGKTLWNY